MGWESGDWRMREDGGDFRRGGAEDGEKWIWDWLSGDWENGKGRIYPRDTTF